ncbi:MAG: serine/threonine-protein kinase [Polyangiaceae bacterium]
MAPALVVQCVFLETKVLADRYRLSRQLGKGGMGSVWLAEHLALNSWVAVKLMDPSIASTAEGAERFKREAQAAASLRSAHVVQVLDYGVHEDTPFLVMELLQGQSLAECIEREKRLTPERTLTVVTQVARAIGRAHAASIVHRDLKPDNIFLIREEDQELAKVLDFGIAKTTGARFGGMETRTGVTMGTPYYMSPEQVEGKRALDHRSDLWSLTVIACECLTGVRPFDGETFGELLLNICARPVTPPSRLGFFLPGFDEWFAKGTHRDPEQRFASAQELAAGLADVVAGRVKAAPLVTPQAAGPDATLPMGPPTMLFTVGQLAPPVTARATTGAAGVGVRTRPPPAQRQRSLLPLVIGVAVAVALALGLLVVLLLRNRDASDATLGLALDAGVAATTNATRGPFALSPETPKAESGVTAGGTAPHVSVASKMPGSGMGGASPVSPPSAAVRPPPSTPTAAAAAPAARGTSCYNDPFTGQLRLAGAGHTSDSFPCRQNPFTGAYQRQ